MKTDKIIPGMILLVIMLSTFTFVFIKLTYILLPSGFVPLFFSEITRILKYGFDVANTHLFSALAATLSLIFKFDTIQALKVSISLVSALVPFFFFRLTRLTTRNHCLSLLAALFGVLISIDLVWAGDYHSVLGLLIFIVFTGQMLLFKQEKNVTVLPFILVPFLFLIEFTLASVMVLMLIYCSIYLFYSKNKLAIQVTALTFVLVFFALTLYAPSKGWLDLALLPSFENLFSVTADRVSWITIPITLSLVSAVTGIIFLGKSYESSIGFSMVGLGFFMVFVNPLYTLSMTVPFALIPLKLLGKSYSCKKDIQNGIAIELDTPKFFSALLSIFTLASLFNYGYYVVSDSPSPYLSNDELYDIMDIIEWISTNLTDQGLIAAPTYLNPLFEGFLGSRIANWRNPQNRLVADALNDTCFRIITPFFMIDELEPLSTCSSPTIYVHDGSHYVSILYIDDSYARFKMLDNGLSFLESTLGATFLNYTLKEDNISIELALSFLTPHLIIQKIIWVSKLEPVMSIKYVAEKRGNVEIVDFILPCWVAWGKGIAESVISHSSTFLVIGSPEGHHSIEIDYVNVTNGPALSRSNTGQEFIKGTYEGDGNYVEGAVEIKVNSSPPSKISGEYFSLFDLREKGISYFLVTNSSPILMGITENKYETLYIDDSFVRFSFKYDDFNYTEAPSYGNVVDEVISEGNESRRTTYQTAGLKICKELKVSSRDLVLLYYVEPSNHEDPMFQELLNSSLEIWIPWERNIETWSFDGSEATIKLDIAEFLLIPHGDITKFIVEPHPEYKQQRILLEFNLKDKTDPENTTIGVSIISRDKDIILEYIETARPSMSGADIAEIIVTSKPFEETYTKGKYVLLEVLPV